MSPAPTPQLYDPSSWFDDPNIEADEVLVRFCKTGAQITWDRRNRRYILSDKIFSASQGGISVELRSLLQRAALSMNDRAAAHANCFGAVGITAGDVRGTINKDSNGKDIGPLCIAYTPIAAGHPHGPNEFHADIFPEPSQSTNGRLTKYSVTLLDIDQAKARIAYGARTGGKFPDDDAA